MPPAAPTAAAGPATAGRRRSFLPRWLGPAASLLALFLIVAGARIWLVRTYTTALPYADQWDGEGAGVLKPFAEGQLHFRDLFLPHNEHRIVLTRLLGLALFAANGQWDGQLETAVNAALCGAFAVLAAGALIRAFGEGWRWTILAGSAVYGVLPFGWENTFSGFASQTYFLIIFSLAAIWGMGLHRAGTAAWWAGLAGAVLACASMGSGFMAAVAVLGLLSLRAWRERVLPGRREWTTATACAGVAALGWLTRTVVPAHAILRTTSPAAFVRAWCRFLAWPHYNEAALVLPMAAPLILLAAVYARRSAVASRSDGGSRERAVELLLGAGGWCVLQAAALAYARDGHGAPPACRYMDVLAIFPLINFLAAALLVARLTRVAGWRGAVAGWATGAVWLGLLVVGLYWETEKDFRGWLPTYREQQERGEANIRGYLNTGDFPRYLAGKSQDEIAYPNPARLAELLNDPTYRRFLPADIRAPLHLQMAGTPDGLDHGAFVPGGFAPTMAAPPWTRCWGSYPGARGSGSGDFMVRDPSACGLPYLQFQFAGDLGEPGLKFVLRGATSGGSVEWRPAHVPHERWRIDYLRRPDHELRLEAASAAAGRWFAFTEPVEVGEWSYWAGYALRRAGDCLVAGLVLACLALTGDLWSRGVKTTRFGRQPPASR